MKSTAKRTLVKSAPELWELADDPQRMHSWLRDLADRPIAGVEVTERKAGQSLAWRTGDVGLALELAEGSFGTSVTISASNAATAPATAEATLERLLDELGSPERRPFTRA